MIPFQLQVWPVQMQDMDLLQNLCRKAASVGGDG